MGLFDSREEKAAKQAEKDAKQRAKNRAWHEANAKKSAIIRGASDRRNQVSTTAEMAAGFDIANMSAAKASDRRAAEKRLIDDLGEKKARKAIKDAANKVAKEFGSK